MALYLEKTDSDRMMMGYMGEGGVRDTLGVTNLETFT